MPRTVAQQRGKAVLQLVGDDAAVLRARLGADVHVWKDCHPGVGKEG